MSSTARSWLLFLVFAAAAGCGARSGPKLAKLDPAQATALDLVMVGGGTGYCVHGDAPQIRAVVTLADGSRLETWANGESRDGKLSFEQLELSASFGVMDRSGQLRTGNDPFALLEREIELSAAVATRPEITDRVTVQPRFDCGGVVDASGAPGQGGLHGAAGRTGRAGQSGDSTRQATDGEDGGHGQDGGDGSPGQSGPQVVVAVGYVQSPSRGKLVSARVSVPSHGGTRYLLVDPAAGKRFVVVARGGAGGSGGSGGSGGAGGPGGSNNIVDGGDGGHGGDGGDGGRGGHGADGGDGGLVTIYYDARYPELESYVAVINTGGPGGHAGSGGYAGSAGTGGSSASGKRGTAGRTGVAGQPGVPGRAGRDGPAAEYIPANAGELFASEAARGLPFSLP